MRSDRTRDLEVLMEANATPERLDAAVIEPRASKIVEDVEIPDRNEVAAIFQWAKVAGAPPLLDPRPSAAIHVDVDDPAGLRFELLRSALVDVLASPRCSGLRKRTTARRPEHEPGVLPGAPPSEGSYSRRMANPDPKALQAAAATMRSQAHEARKAFVPAEGKRDNEALEAQEAALVQKHGAEQAVKDHQEILNRSVLIKTDAQKDIDANRVKIAEAEKTGDTAALEELHERQARLQTVIDQTQGRLDNAQRNLDQAKVDVAERTRDFDEATRRMKATVESDNPAEKQIDALEDKARLLNEAGLKLDLARTIDNPVERADMELDAEKILRQANAIQVDTKQITAITGQELTLPDISALPPMAELPDPSADADVSTTGAGTDGDVASGDAAGNIQDPFAAGGADGDASDTFAASDDVLGVDAADTRSAAAVSTATAPDPVAAVDSTAAPAFDAGSIDVPAADPMPLMDDASAALADTGSDFASAGIDAPGTIDDGSDVEV